MINVLVFGMTDNPGGVESFLMAYYRKIDKTRFHFDFLCNNHTIAYEQELLASGAGVYKICARSENPGRYRRELNAFFRENASRYQAIWVNVCSLANIDYLKAAKKYHIARRIIHSHNSQNMDSRLRGWLHRWNRRHITRYATDFWACSRVAGEWFYSPAVLASPAYREIHNAIDAGIFAFDEGIRQEMRRTMRVTDEWVIGHVGRLHFQKNQSFLLDIFAAIYKKDDHARLWLVGQGEDEQMLREKSARLGVAEAVSFLGVRGDVPRLMQAMDTFVMPSVFEGLSVVLIEAQAAGLPTFASESIVPDEARVTDLLTPVPLSAAPEVWADAICGARGAVRENEQPRLAAAGFDIAQQVTVLEKLLAESGKQGG